MYKVGDMVVYPPYGAGLITAVDMIEYNGSTSEYYVMNMPIGNMVLSVSVAGAGEHGIRSIHSLEDVLNTINSAQPIPMAKNWVQRCKENTAILRSGDFLRTVQVYKTLMLRERVKSLSCTEKKVLTNARNIVLGELILAGKLDKTSAEKMLRDSLLVSA